MLALYKERTASREEWARIIDSAPPRARIALRAGASFITPAGERIHPPLLLDVEDLPLVRASLTIRR